MERATLDKKDLPDEPGVYFFKKGRQILYIGKATSLRSRVQSYFRDDIEATRSPLIRQMVDEAGDITWQVTDSVLEALITEAHFIKRYQPPYNTREKDNKSFSYVVITDERWPRILTVRGHELMKIRSGEIKPTATASGKTSRSKSALTILTRVPIKKVYGPFTSGGALREALKVIRKIFPYRDRKCTPAEEQSGSSPKPCFNYQIGLCPGVCVGSIDRKEYLRLIRNLTLFFEGKKKKLLRTLTREMNDAAAVYAFERAAGLRKAIYALDHINDVALLKRDFLDQPAGDDTGYRVEAYDIAHLAGDAMVGVMTVVTNGEVDTNEYRKFSIRSQIGVDDTAALQEVLHRRLKHTEWTYPNLIVVDGAKAQKNAAQRVLSEYELSIPVVAVTKDERHKPREILANTNKTATKNKDAILLANSESHRFAITYHRKQFRAR